MVFGLFRKGQSKSTACLPEGTVVYAIGDIHGHLNLLLRLEAQITADMKRRAATRRVIVYLGDYVDRGPQSKGVLDHLLGNPIAGCETVHVTGNHDRWMLNFIDSPASGQAWLKYGGSQTLQSYGVSAPKSFDVVTLEATRAELAKVLPASHRAFLARMPLSHQEGDYFFVHAGVRPGVPLDEQDEEDLLWIREEFLYSDQDFGKIVVHGHTPTQTPEEHKNRISIDTGAYMSGTLTAVVLDGTTRSFFRS